MPREFSVFEKLFSNKNEYFSDFYLKFESNDLKNFFSKNDEKRKCLTHFYFYVESLFPVKNLPDEILSEIETPGSLAPLHANELWYSVLITILIGINQQTSSTSSAVDVCKICKKARVGKIQLLFVSTMNLLEESDKKYLMRNYKCGAFQKKTYEKLVKNIYGDRCYFAHDIANLKPPEKSGIVLETTQKGAFLNFNTKPEEVILFIIKAIMRDWGYQGTLKVASRREHRSLVDFC